MVKSLESLLNGLDKESESYQALFSNKNDIERLLNETKAALESKDFLAAYESESQIKALLSETRALVDKELANKGSFLRKLLIAIDW